MKRSTAYTELEERIARDWQVKSLHEIIQMLEEAENDKRIDVAERDALIEVQRLD